MPMSVAIPRRGATHPAWRPSPRVSLRAGAASTTPLLAYIGKNATKVCPTNARHKCYEVLVPLTGVEDDDDDELLEPKLLLLLF